MVMFDEKAQLHTLEGVAAATLILLVIIYAIDATSITPLTSSTSNAHVESELMTLGQDILNTLDYKEPGYNSQLKSDILNWTGGQYIWTGNDYKENDGSANLNSTLNSSLAQNLKTTLISQGIAHRVEVVFLLKQNNITLTSAPETMIDAGIPSDNAVVVSRKIVLQNTDNPLNNSKIQDIDTTSNLYNIVDIRLFLWRI